MCANCVEVPDYLRDIAPIREMPSKDNIPEEETTTTAQTYEIAELQTALSQKTTEMNVLVESNKKLTKTINELHKELEKKNGRTKKGKEEYNKLQAKAKQLKNGILTYEDMISSLNATIAKQSSELKEVHDNSIVEVTAEDTNIKMEQMMIRKLEQIEKASRSHYLRKSARITKV